MFKSSYVYTNKLHQCRCLQWLNFFDLIEYTLWLWLGPRSAQTWSPCPSAGLAVQTWLSSSKQCFCKPQLEIGLSCTSQVDWNWIFGIQLDESPVSWKTPWSPSVIACRTSWVSDSGEGVNGMLALPSFLLSLAGLQDYIKNILSSWLSQNDFFFYDV